MADKFSNLTSAEKALRGIGAARSGKKPSKPTRIVPKSALELQVNPNAGSAKVAAEPAVRTRAIEQAIDTANMGASSARVRSLRELLHSLEGQDAFRSLKPEIQQGIIADAAKENPAWKAEFEAVKKADKGVAVPVQKIDDGSPADDVLQLGKDDPKIGEPSPEGVGDRRRQASADITTEHVRADGSREKVEYSTPEYEQRKYVDMDKPEDSRLNKGELPGDIRKALQSTGNLPLDGQKTSELENLLNHALSESKVRLESAMESSPDDAANIMADPIAHGGLFTAEEIQTLRQLEDMSPEDAKTQRLSIITQRQDIAHKVADRLRSEGGEGAPSPELMERARSWQGNQTIRKPGVLDKGSKSLLRLKPGFDMEPYDLSPAQNLRQISLGEGGGTFTKGSEVVGKDGNLVEGETQSGFSSQSGRGSSRIGRLVAADQRGRLPVTHQVLTEDAADGTLKYPQEAFRTMIEMASRLEENKNWYSVQSAIARVETYINKYRKSQGLPNLQWTPEMSRTLDAAIRKEGRVAGGATPASGTLEGRVAASKATDKALRELRTTLGTDARKLGVAPPVGGARPASDAPAMTETDPAGIVSPGTSQDASRLPPAAENVRGPDAKRATPAQRNLATGELETRTESADDIARNDAFAQALSESMNTGNDRPLNDYWGKYYPEKKDASKPAAAATEAPADGSLAEVPAALPVKKARGRKKKGEVEAPPAPPAEASPAAVVEEAAPTPAAADNLPAVPAAMTGESEITGFIKKKGLDAAVKQFGQDAVDADGKLVGKRWVPNAAPAPKPAAAPAPVAKPAETEVTAPAKPVEEAAKPAPAAATPAPRTLPADAPPIEQMRNLAEQWGVPHEGVSDIDLFDALEKASAAHRAANPEPPPQVATKPPVGTTIRRRSRPGDVVDGENLPGEVDDGEVFPPIPESMQASAGELTTEVTPPPKGPAKLTPGTGRMPASSSSTAGKPKPEGVITSSSGKPRVIEGAKEAVQDPAVAPESTTHIPSARTRQVNDEPKFNEDADWMKPYVDEDGNTARLPTTDEDVVTFDPNLPEPPKGPTLIDRIVGPKDKRWGNVARIAGIAAVPPIAGMVLGERSAPPETSSDPSKAFSHWHDATGSAPVPAHDAPPSPAAAPEAQAPRGGPPGLNWPDATGGGAAAAPPGFGGAGGEQAINRAAGGVGDAIGPAEAERLSRVLKSVAAARMYGYGQYGPAY